MSKLKSGFTLVELLVVIAVLGVLATVLLVIINPLEQLARGRDGGRKSVVGQLGRAASAYYIARNATYPPANTAWITTLQTAGEVKTLPVNPTYSIASPACTLNPQNGWCYYVNPGLTEATIVVGLESSSEKSKCANPLNPWFTWDSLRNTTCLVCAPGDGGAAGGVACNPTQ